MGFIAGIIGAIPMNAMNLFNFYVTHLAKLRYLDFAGYMVFGKLPRTIGEVVFSQVVQLAFSGVLGALFASFLQWVTHKNIWFKGLLWGNGAWFVLYTITVLYRIPVLSRPNLSTAFMQYLSTAIYGIVMALTFSWLVGKAETEGSEPKYHKYRVVPVPAMKKEHRKVRLVKPKKFKIPKR